MVVFDSDGAGIIKKTLVTAGARSQGRWRNQFDILHVHAANKRNLFAEINHRPLFAEILHMQDLRIREQKPLTPESPRVVFLLFLWMDQYLRSSNRKLEMWLLDIYYCWLDYLFSNILCVNDAEAWNDSKLSGLNPKLGWWLKSWPPEQRKSIQQSGSKRKEGKTLTINVLCWDQWIIRPRKS